MAQLYKRKGGELLVNTETLNNQSGGSLTLLPGGGYVVIWSDGSGLGGDASGFGIKAQLFDANGARVGAEFLVNAETFADQSGAAVTTLSSGRFVVTWTAYDTINGGEFQDAVIRGRIFEANGTPAGAEFQVNASTAGFFQVLSSVTELSGGGFVAVWLDSDDNGDVLNLKAQRFDANGGKLGGEFIINTGTTAPNFTGGAVLALPGGGFAVAWTSGDQKLQLFDAAGNKVGGVQTVSAADTGVFTASNINALGSGFIITWAQQDNVSFPGVPNTHDLHAQRYDAAGNKLGAEILVNSTRTGSQTVNDAHELPGGGFIIVWQGPAEGTSDINIYGQVFAADGSPAGGEFIVTTTTAGNQTSPTVEVLASGDIVITYTDSAGDASGFGVRMQVLTLASNDAPTDIALSDTTISEVAIENLPVATLSATMGALNSAPVYTIVSDETGGAFRIDGDKLVVQDSSKLDFETNPGVDVRIRVTDSNGSFYEETLTINVADVVTETRFSAGEVFDAGAQSGNSIALTKVAAGLVSGGFVAFTTFSDGGSHYRFQLFGADGQPGATRLVEIPTSSASGIFASGLAAAGLASGGFVVLVAGPPVPEGSTTHYPIVAQRFDAAGNEVGGEIQISPDGGLGGPAPSFVAALTSGGFVTIWSYTGALMARVVDANGQPLGDAVTVHSEPGGGIHFDANVVASPDGGFIVTWSYVAFDDPTESASVGGQRYDASGNEVGGELALLTGLDNYDTQLISLANGNFVVAWLKTIVSDDLETSVLEARAQVFNPNGTAIGSPAVVTLTGGDTYYLRATADGFMLTWNTLTPEYDIQGFSQFFDSLARPVGEAFQIIDGGVPLTVSLESGGVGLVWGNVEGTQLHLTSQVLAVEASANPTPGPDTLNGTANADTIDGLGGNDVINGLGGDDILTGGAGDDIVHGGDNNDTITELSGTNDQLFGDDGNDRLVYRAASGAMTVLLDGGAGDDVLIAQGVNGNDVVTLNGGSGADRISLDFGATVTINAGEGADIVQIEILYDQQITLGTGSDLVAFSDVPFREGSVTIHDFTAGDAGDVINLAGILISNSPASSTNPFGTNAIQLTQEGANAILRIDTDFIAGSLTAIIVLENVQASSLTAYNLAGYSPAGSATSPLVLGGGTGPDFLTGQVGNDTLSGQGGDDVLYGAAGNDQLAGGAGNDELHGQFGNDVLDGGAGADQLDGGVGDDIYFVDNAGDVIVETAGWGYDTAYASISYALGANISVEVLSAASWGGAAPLALTGNNLANTVYGNAGDNVLDGGAGADVLNGQGGHDVYFLDNVGDVVVESAGGGFDTVFTSVSYTLGAGVAAEILSVVDWSATTPIALTGNELANRLYGNAGANVLTGGAGDDWLTGFGGGDTLVGGQGADVYWIHATDEAITETAGNGYDTVYAFIGFTLASDANVEVVSTYSWIQAESIDLTGNGLANVLFGNAGINTLNGGLGNDRMTGFGGADTFAFTTALGADNVDTVVDFVAGTDKVGLDDAIFTQAGPLGALNANAFVTGSAAGDADDRIIYNSATGALLYDADGNGAGAAVQFATLSIGLSLSASDFMVI